jgi:hypothetical protein
MFSENAEPVNLGKLTLGFYDLTERNLVEYLNAASYCGRIWVTIRLLFTGKGFISPMGINNLLKDPLRENLLEKHSKLRTLLKVYTVGIDVKNQQSPLKNVNSTLPKNQKKKEAQNITEQSLNQSQSQLSDLDKTLCQNYRIKNIFNDPFQKLEVPAQLEGINLEEILIVESEMTKDKVEHSMEEAIHEVIATINRNLMAALSVMQWKKTMPTNFEQIKDARCLTISERHIFKNAPHDSFQTEQMNDTWLDRILTALQAADHISSFKKLYPKVYTVQV